MFRAFSAAPALPHCVRTSPLASLRIRLTLLVAVTVVPAVLLNIYSTVRQQRWAMEEIRHSALRMSRAVAAEQAHVTSGVQELLTALSMVPAIRTAEAERCPALLNDLLALYPHYTSLSVVTPTGDLVCRGLRPGEPAQVQGLAVESAFRRAVESRAFSIGSYAVGTLTHKPVVPFALPLLGAEDELEAVLTATLDLVWLSRYAQDAELPGGAVITVVDGSGTVLAHFPDPERWVGTRLRADSPFRHILLQPGEGVAEARDLDGADRLYAFSRLPAPESLPVMVIVGMPREDMVADVNRMLARNLLFLVLLGVVAASAGWGVGTRTILRPVRSLVDATRRLASGDLRARAGNATGGGELAELSYVFNEMAASLQQRTAETTRSVAALRRSEERYRSLVEATAAIVWNAPASGAFESPQPQWSEFTGQRFEEHREWGWLQAVHPEDRARIAHAWSRALEEGTLFQAELRLRRHDGVCRHMLMRAVPIRDEQGELREWIGVHTDITDRKRTEEQRAALLAREQELRADAERANRAKSDFLAIVSHELRTPLTSIISYAELMASDVGGALSERHREFVERIDASAWQLKELVDQILEFTRLEAGQVSVQVMTTDLGGVIRDTVANVAPLAAAKSLSLRVTVPETGVVAETDPVRVRQILLNLLSNAIKFCDRGHVHVELSAGAERVQIRVRDTGPGIAPEHQDLIWEKFWQAETPLTRRAGGTGLGLPIVRHLTGLLGGTVTVESTVGEGSTFIITLPSVSTEAGSPSHDAAGERVVV